MISTIQAKDKLVPESLRMTGLTQSKPSMIQGVVNRCLLLVPSMVNSGEMRASSVCHWTTIDPLSIHPSNATMALSCGYCWSFTVDSREICTGGMNVEESTSPETTNVGEGRCRLLAILSNLTCSSKSEYLRVKSGLAPGPEATTHHLPTGLRLYRPT